MKVLYCWDSDTILTCQNPLLKSILEKCAVPTNASWIHSKGYESFFVCVLSLQKSTQKCSNPSFFFTNTTVLHHGDRLGHITPTSSISQSVGVHLLQKWWGYLSESLLKWFTIGNANLMLNCTSTTKLIPFQCKNVGKAKMRS